MVFSWWCMSQTRPSSGWARNFSKGARSPPSSNGIEGGCSARCRIIERSTGRSRGLTSVKLAEGALFTALLDQFGYQPSPARLVTRANSGAIVSMKIFMEQDQVLPVRIVIENLGATRHRPAAILAAQKDTDEPARNLSGHLPQICFLAGTGGALHFEILAIVMVKLLQRFDQQIVHRKPDRPAPIGIAAEDFGGGFRRLVLHAVHMAIHVNLIRMIFVIPRKRTHSEIRQKFRLIQHAGQHALQLPPVD